MDYLRTHVRELQPRPARNRFRRHIATGALIALIVVVGLGVLGLPHLRPDSGVAAMSEPQVREFTLTASEIDWEISPGTTVRAWAYNGQVPGPEIRVTEGDLVRITLKNELPVGTTIHWHGIDNTPAMDGPAGLNQAPVEPGEEFVYEFTAAPGGSRMYHSHTDVAMQVGLGLYGPLIVEPREPAQTYDREYTYMLAEWDDELTPDVATGKAPRGPRDQMLRGGELGADLFLMNGHADAAIPSVAIAEGERVLIRLMNIGNLAHPIHTHGHSFKIVATDGNPVPAGMELVKDTVLIGPGERYDIELYGDNPGVWMFHCHIESHAANGMMTLIAYDGEVPTGPYADFWNAAGTPDLETNAQHGGMHGAPAVTPTPAGSDPVEEPAPPSDEPVADGNTVVVELFDDRFTPPSIEVPAGTTVTWVNKGGDRHTVSAFDKSFKSQSLAPGESFSYTFTEPGEYRYICTHHARQGMLGQVTVT